LFWEINVYNERVIPQRNRSIIRDGEEKVLSPQLLCNRERLFIDDFCGDGIGKSLVGDNNVCRSAEALLAVSGVDADHIFPAFAVGVADDLTVINYGTGAVNALLICRAFMAAETAVIVVGFDIGACTIADELASAAYEITAETLAVLILAVDLLVAVIIDVVVAAVITILICPRLCIRLPYTRGFAIGFCTAVISTCTVTIDPVLLAGAILWLVRCSTGWAAGISCLACYAHDL
jgi:hypothetical protein